MTGSVSASRPTPESTKQERITTAAAPSAPTPAQSGGRQRWRLYLRMPAASAPGELPAGSGAWTAVLERCGLQLAHEPGRGRAAPAAQLPLGIAGEREIVDAILADRLPAAEIRMILQRGLPPRVELVDLHDVWVGAPSASATLAAADYRVEVDGVSPRSIWAAVEVILAARDLARERRREKKTQVFDLRPLILSLTVEAQPPSAAGVDGPSAVLRARLRHGPDAVGRPEDVVAALAAPPAPPLDGEIRVLSIVRERLLTADEV